MQDNIVLDVNEDDINQLNRDLLATLLFDRTTRKNNLWGTDDYKDLGDAYAAGNPITEYLITGSNGKVIQPRVLKAQEQKKDRTPSPTFLVCNKLHIYFAINNTAPLIRQDTQHEHDGELLRHQS